MLLDLFLHDLLRHFRLLQGRLFFLSDLIFNLQFASLSLHLPHLVVQIIQILVQKHLFHQQNFGLLASQSVGQLLEFLAFIAEQIIVLAVQFLDLIYPFQAIVLFLANDLFQVSIANGVD